MICEPVYDLEEAVFSDVVVEATVPLGFSRKRGAHEDDGGLASYAASFVSGGTVPPRSYRASCSP